MTTRCSSRGNAGVSLVTQVRIAPQQVRVPPAPCAASGRRRLNTGGARAQPRPTSRRFQPRRPLALRLQSSHSELSTVFDMGRRKADCAVARQRRPPAARKGGENRSLTRSRPNRNDDLMISELAITCRKNSLVRQKRTVLPPFRARCPRQPVSPLPTPPFPPHRRTDPGCRQYRLQELDATLKLPAERFSGHASAPYAATGRAPSLQADLVLCNNQQRKYRPGIHALFAMERNSLNLADFPISSHSAPQSGSTAMAKNSPEKPSKGAIGVHCERLAPDSDGRTIGLPRNARNPGGSLPSRMTMSWPSCVALLAEIPRQHTDVR